MSDLLEFRHFRYLIAVAEEQNITRAAKRLFVAQPSLSAQIKSMEESLLVDLLVRAPKGIKLTPAAEVLTAGARQILALRDDVIANSARFALRQIARCITPRSSPVCAIPKATPRNRSAAARKHSHRRQDSAHLPP